MSDPSDRFAQTLPCGCELQAGQTFFCPRHQPLHGDHQQPVPGCDLCDAAMDEARQIQAEHPWWDEAS